MNNSLLKKLPAKLLLLACASLAITAVTFADDAAPFAPNDLAGLKGKVGQTVEIEGAAVSTGASSSGKVVYLNFDRKPHTSVSVVFFTSGEHGGSVKTADDLKQFVGKTVTVKGELSDYKDDLQIVLQSPDDIHIKE